MKRDDNEINLNVKIPFHKRTYLNYTHTVNVDSQINSISTWRKSQTKFKKSILKNILTFGILHIISLFFPKLYLKLYCKSCPPKESDFFLVEDINGFSILCKSIYKKINNINNSKKVIFEYFTMKYEYDEGSNTIIPIYFNLSLLKNSELLYKYSEGLTSDEMIKNLTEKYGQNVMQLKKNILYQYFIKPNMRQILNTLLSIFFFYLGNKKYFMFCILLVSLLTILIRVIYKYITFRQLYCSDDSLDGMKNLKKYKAIRRNMQKSQSKYCYIKNTEILPGDILLLREEDFIPCDGIILEGECLLNINNLSGNTDHILRISLENNNNYFNYLDNKKNIVFQGMKILKIYTKNILKEITIIAVNTGSNTFKANFYNNLLIKKKDKIYRNMTKNIFNKYYLIFSLVLFFISNIIIIIIHYKYNPNSREELNNYIFILIGIILMPIHFIIENVIKLISVIHLNKNKIQCTDESKINESGNIDTVIFSKSGNKNEYKIIAFCPLYFESETKKISIKGFEKNEEQNITNILNNHLKYYKKLYRNINDNNYISNNLNEGIKNEELNALFLQSLICCSSLIKINNEICGEKIDKEIFEKLNWEINSIGIKDNSDENSFSDEQKQINEKLISLIEEIKIKGSIFIHNFDNNINYNSFNIISEVFPKDYYKITEEKNNKVKKNVFLSNKNEKNIINSKEKKIFKIIIIQKFNNLSCLTKSCITYNLLDNKCLFMTKGPPDKILKYCIPKSVPCIDKILSKLIKNGYKIIAYAVKYLELYQIYINKDEDYYMKDLNFVGFIIIENKFKKEISQIVEKINKMSCNNSISSLISTNDNIYNAIEGGLKSGIINKNNVYVFDIGKTENEGRVVFAKYIYDKEEKNNEYKFKQKLIQENKTLLSSIYNDKNIKQIDYLKENNISNYEINSLMPIDSKRKMIPSDTGQTENFKNNNIYEEKEKESQNKEELNTFFMSSINKNFNLLHSSLHKRTIIKKNTSYSFQKNEKETEISFNKMVKNRFKNLKNEEIINNNSDKDSNNDDLEKDFNLVKIIQNKKRRRTTKSNFKFNFKNKNISHDYEYLYFRRYENQIEPFKHECVLCFSGKLLKYIFSEIERNKNKNSVNFENYKLDILISLLKHRVKIFYLMSPEEKTILIKFYRKYLNKSVCLVGNSSSDIESLVLSNIGIMIGPPINFNTLFAHFYLCDKNILNLEKILKNGRSYYENNSLLILVTSIFTLLSVTLIIFTYNLNTKITSKRYIFINFSVFLLSLSAFTVQPNYSISANYLITNNKLFLIYSMVKLIGTIIIKYLAYFSLRKFYKKNDDNTLQKNQEILTTYYFIFTWADLFSIIFAFNTQSFFREHIINNILFIFLFFAHVIYLIMNLTLSDISINNYSNYLLIDFENNKNEIDVFEDFNKIKILIILIIDFFVTYLYIKLITIFFEKYANKIK